MNKSTTILILCIIALVVVFVVGRFLNPQQTPDDQFVPPHLDSTQNPDQDPGAEPSDSTPADPNQAQRPPQTLPPSTPNPPSSGLPALRALAGSEFRAVSFNGKALNWQTRPTVTFETGGRLGARFCNYMGGDYTDRYGVLTASELVQTLMYCTEPTGLMDMESSFATMLRAGASYERNGSVLTMRGGGIEMVFEEV